MRTIEQSERRKAGRPAGSKNVKRAEVVAVKPVVRCPRCGSTERTRYNTMTRQETQSEIIERKSCRCLGCGQNLLHKIITRKDTGATTHQHFPAVGPFAGMNNCKEEGYQS